MTKLTFLFLSFLVAATFASHQNYPGTKTRPVLSDSEAAGYTKQKYLEGWTPENVHTNKADFIVGSGHYEYIQEAVDAAIKAGGTSRKYIRIEKGKYKQVIFIPKTNVPLTIYGATGKPEDVYISIDQSGNTPGSTWAKTVNPGGKAFKEGGASWSMYEDCAKRATIGQCNPIIWAKGDNVEFANFVVDNPSKDGPAQAARSNGDKQNWYNVHFYGYQDTLLIDGGGRAYFNSPTIKGDVDFIFGNSRAVFEHAEIIARADRPRDSAVLFAPNTEESQKYGFLVVNSKLTAENGIAKKKGCHLARAWDSSKTVNGQVVIRETHIDDVINVNGPYDTAAGGRAYSGNPNKNRNLDDSHYNRFWEYKNTGSGA